MTAPGRARPGRAAAPWYRRAALELRNVAITVVLGLVLIAVVMGVVILVNRIVSG